MDELRWVLLGLGALFLGGLAIWELRKPRHSGRNEDTGAFTTSEPGAHRRVEPRFGENAEAAYQQSELPAMRAVETGGDPPVMILDERVEGPSTMGISIASSVAVDSPGMHESVSAEVPPFDVPSVAALVADDDVDVAPAGEPEPALPPPAEPAAPAERHQPPEPQWPDEDRRRIISLRLVPRAPARFMGRSLRQAFESCGLEFGAFDIFHLVDDAGAVFASAANLMRPGTFAPATMDSQHFLGVHLFCVLPGPLPAGRAVDELIALARDLAQRLSGSVLDEVGQPLDEERAAAVRAAAEQAESLG
jgi:ZipA-like protein with FtsZ-binding domain